MSTIKFKVNGVEYTVGSDVTSDVMLLDYLRNYLQLRGTKYMCREGGCGSCMVNASKKAGSPFVAVNSCMVSVTSCHGWEILTIEGLGNKKDGYHELQTTLAENNGSQCGYCSPGWVMAMHGLLEVKPDVTMLEVEKSFGSNLCRCTGYRPILDSFKKFAKDAPAKERIMNLKNLAICKSRKCCTTSGCGDKDGWCMIQEDEATEEKMIQITLKDGKIWYRPNNLNEVLALLKENAENYMLVGGNTAKGAYLLEEYPKRLMDISCIEELRAIEYDQNLIVGAALTLTELMDVFKAGAEKDNFKYLSKLYDHIDLVAHIPVRNIGTVGGNLMIKHMYSVYQSDLYLLFDTVGAQVTIVDYHGNEKIITMLDFLSEDMKGKVIKNVLLPPLGDDFKIWTYKLMPRSQSAHAIVNAGFLYKINATTNLCEEARIVYGALSTKFPRALATESYLVGKNPFDNETLQGALRVLDGEMIVEENPPEPSVEYKRFIAKSLFFKGLLTLCPSTKRGARFESGIIDLHATRPLSSAQHSYSSDSSLWPYNQPMPKLEAKIQCAGEAKYTEDMPSIHNEVFAAFVLSTVAVGTIAKIDATTALKLNGVIAFYTAADIPGLNSYTPADGTGGVTTANMEVFCEGTVKYNGQPIGVIVAETQVIADRAAKLVEVKYTNTSTPVVDIKEAKSDSSRNTLFISVDATNPGSEVHKTISGTNVIYGQYHFPMETLVSIAKPTEEGLEVHLATQWLDGPQTMIARALNMDANKIDIHCRRLGGAYGFKIICSLQGAVACSLVAKKLNRPCRIISPIFTNMKAFGKRAPNFNEYEVAVNKSGIIQYVTSTIYTDNGYMVNEPIIGYGYDVYNNCYDVTKVNYKAYNSVTDTAKNTFCRSPGTLEAIAFMETIMERISYEMSLDPLTVRLDNLDTTNYGDMKDVVETLKTSAEYTTRRGAVDSFNTQNRWKKRGLRWALCRWAPAGGQILDVNMAIYHTDGTVAITHSGMEMGQGINTKVAQVAAYLLKVPVDKIVIKGNDTINCPNAFVTGGSLTTENLIVALKKCVADFETRMAPIRATLTEPTWLELINAAYAAYSDLQFHGYVNFADIQKYNMCSAALAEVEVDCLTGEFEILRVDIRQDVGVSVNPDIDLGQVEGGFMMGLGYWTCEKLDYDKTTGLLLSNRTWDYHLPEARDIPQDLRVTFRPSYSSDLILGAKAIGEPVICLSVVVPFAIREAITEARRESGIPTSEWYNIDGPCSTENICMAMKTDTADFKFY